MLTLTINGTQHSIASDPDTPLIYVLRDELKLKGTKLGCALEQCGACTVLADGEAVQTCATPVALFEDKDIVTVEGISNTDAGQRVQQAFVDARAAQCGYCTAGLVVAVTALAQSEHTSDRDKVKEALDQHLCRCGSHPRVMEAATSVLTAET